MDFREHEKYKSGVFKTKSELEDMLRANGITKIYYVLSFGAGTQSTHMFEDHLQGKAYYDLIAMADTGAEPDFIKNQVEWWKARKEKLKNKTPFVITTHNSMTGGLEEMLFRYIHADMKWLKLPIYCSKKQEDGSEQAIGIMPRKCTSDFKIVPVKQAIRQFILKDLGLKPNQNVPKNIGVIMDIGFSSDEIKRINGYVGYDYTYMYMSYPLVEQNLSTQDSIDFLTKNKMPKKRSRCYICPFNCNMEGMDWEEIIKEEPLSFLKACWFDDQLRVVQATGTKALESIPYFHFSRKPLQEVFSMDYWILMSMYEAELNQWVADWKAYVTEKYLDMAS
jgi:hypothetical protein